MKRSMTMVALFALFLAGCSSQAWGRQVDPSLLEPDSCDKFDRGPYGFLSGHWRLGFGEAPAVLSAGLPQNFSATFDIRFFQYEQSDLLSEHNLIVDGAEIAEPASANEWVTLVGKEISIKSRIQGASGSGGCWVARSPSLATLGHRTSIWNAKLGRRSLIAAFDRPRLVVIGLGDYLGETEIEPTRIAGNCRPISFMIYIDGTPVKDSLGSTIYFKPANSVLTYGSRISIEWRGAAECNVPGLFAYAAGTIKMQNEP